jgi:hypothetical protein
VAGDRDHVRRGLELAAERDAARSHSDRATRRLDEAIAEQDTRRREAGRSDSHR